MKRNSEVVIAKSSEIELRAVPAEMIFAIAPDGSTVYAGPVLPKKWAARYRKLQAAQRASDVEQLKNERQAYQWLSNFAVKLLTGEGVPKVQKL